MKIKYLLVCILIILSMAGCSNINNEEPVIENNTDSEVIVDKSVENTEEYNDNEHTDFSKLVGTKFTDIELPMLDGSTFRISDYSGKYVVINLWASWCKTCIDELPDLAKLEQVFNKYDAYVININHAETSEVVEEFLKDRELTHWNVALDSEKLIKAEFGVDEIPFVFYIDKDGIIQYVKPGVHKDNYDRLYNGFISMVE